jgi:small subunit ribosomal protein S1
VLGTCRIARETPPQIAEQVASTQAKADLSSLSSMLQARWKGAASSGGAKPQATRAGEIRSFRIARLDPEAKKIELELVTS